MEFSEIVGKPISSDKPVNRTFEPTGMIAPAEQVDMDLESPHLPESARSFLSEQGFDPDLFDIKSMWQDGATGEMRFSFKSRVAAGVSAALTDAELDRVVSAKRQEFDSLLPAETASRTALVLLGDMQFGKIDGDGIEGTLARLFSALDEAYFEVESTLLTKADIGEVVVAFLGDHIEGFVSQGGANAWRTQTPLTEQVRITRRTMLYAMELFTDLGLPLKMVAVPGNHGEAVRFQGGGVTRYDDSFDTEALIAVADAARLSERYADVQFFVPDTDELAVGLDCSGTYVMFAHGHMARSQHKLMEWVKGQAFNRDSVFAGADLAVFGHFHSFYVETSSDRTVMVIPSFESESTWYKHKTGTTGDPGLVVAYTSEGRTDGIRLVR